MRCPGPSSRRPPRACEAVICPAPGQRLPSRVSAVSGKTSLLLQASFLQVLASPACRPRSSHSGLPLALVLRGTDRTHGGRFENNADGQHRNSNVSTKGGRARRCRERFPAPGYDLLGRAGGFAPEQQRDGQPFGPGASYLRARRSGHQRSAGRFRRRCFGHPAEPLGVSADAQPRRAFHPFVFAFGGFSGAGAYVFCGGCSGFSRHSFGGATNAGRGERAGAPE